MKACMTCKKMSDLPDHLYELSIVCEHANIEDNINPSPISEWLKLAANLDSVVISTDKYAVDDYIYCDSAYEQHQEDNKYFSLFQTALTRFLYVSNALEEVYRSFSKHLPKEAKIKGKPIRADSIKCMILLEKIDKKHLPEDFMHHSYNLTKKFEKYINFNKPEINNPKEYPSEHQCHALNIVRNMRNYLAHGVIPINTTPYLKAADDHWYNLYETLTVATRVAAFYIQSYLSKYVEHFFLDDYLNDIGYYSVTESQEELANPPPFPEYLKAPRNLPELLCKLHLKDAFGFLKIKAYF